VRRRILVVALSAAILAIAVFGIPLAFAVDHSITADERSELERLGLRAAVTVSPSYVSGDPVELPATHAPEELGVYDASGQRVTGAGPPHLESALDASMSGRIASATTDGDLLVAVPVASGERVIAVVRAASARSALRSRIGWTWAGMGGIALVAAGCAGGLAAAQSRRLTQPLSRLAGVATDLGEGNFAARSGVSGVPEIDRAGQALNETAERLGDLVARERAFSAHASHQLRTPLTGLRLELEAGLAGDETTLRTAAEEAIRSADQLARTIDEVLALARSTGGSQESWRVEGLLTDLNERWHGLLAAAGRPLRIVLEDPPVPGASLAAARQILDVLVDNAYRHGEGAVTIRARESAGAVAVDVIDQGSSVILPLPAASEHFAEPSPQAGRLGLALASGLAEAEGGRILQAIGESHTRVILLLPSG
jgi:signal transduction histidine kinase